MKKKGFSLSEMLVTLAIIAFVAGLMFPALHNAQPNQELVMVRKAYYLTSRIVSELINDEDFYPDREDQAQSGFSNIKIADLLGTEATYHGQTFGGDASNTSITFPGNQKFCGLFASRLNLKEDPDCTQKNLSSSNSMIAGNFTTADGIVWMMPISNFSSGKENIYIDVNGFNKGHNCFPDTCGGIAPDQFKFTVDRFGKIEVDNPITREYLSGNYTAKTYQEIVQDLRRRGVIGEE